MVRYRESDVNDFIDSGLASKPVILNINIPSAFDELPDRTILTRKEVCQIIGKGANAIPSLMVKGAIPRPINEITASRRSSLVWRLGSIRALKDKAQSSEV
jgi:predicted DNA-binding transcriptional regulator AlpA